MEGVLSRGTAIIVRIAASEADRIHDAAQRMNFLDRIAENRDIVALWTARQGSARRPTKVV